MKLDSYEKEQRILTLLEKKGTYMTARDIAESIYGKGKHQSIVFSKLEEMVRAKKINKMGAQQPYSYGISSSISTTYQLSSNKEASVKYKSLQSPIYTNILFEKSDAYYDLIRSDPHARYLSWEHCYCYFHENYNSTDSEVRKIACLHLACYLASWGMLRNSFLVQQDYLVHMDVVGTLFSKDYIDLFKASIDDLEADNYIDMIFALADKIRKLYSPYAKKFNADVTDTLITKVLLGTLGCVPAYDRFFKDGLKISGVASSNFTKSSLKSLIGYYLVNRILFGEPVYNINHSLKYPPMKIIDMCFWQIGYTASLEKQ